VLRFTSGFALRTYPLLRSLHLYLGLFISPFIVVFSVSVFFLVHSWLPGSSEPPTKRSVVEVVIPGGLETEKGAAQTSALRGVLDALNVRGEIGFIRYSPQQLRFNLPVTQPGRETQVELHVSTRTAVISSRTTGIADAVVYLHKMPGPHNVALRGNSVHVQVWRWLADITVYLLLLVTTTGIYLWVVLKAERRVGIALIGAGALTCGGMIYALLG
jgi:hypothetical protein